MPRKKVPYKLYTKEEILNVIEIMLNQNLMVECSFATRVMHSGGHVAEGYTETKSMTFGSHRSAGDVQKFWITGRSETKA